MEGFLKMTKEFAQEMKFPESSETWFESLDEIRILKWKTLELGWYIFLHEYNSYCVKE